MADLIPMLAAVAGQAGEEADEDFNQTVLLLHGDGTNGAQNNTFLDGSTNNFTITRNGNTTQGTFSPFSVGAGEWSNYFDGNGDYLQVPDNAALELGSGDFTIESWIYISGDNADSSAAIIAKYSVSPNPNFMLRITKDGSATYNKFILNIAGVEYSANFSFVYHKWYHVAVVRNSSALDLYIDGVDVGGGAASFTVSDSSEPVRIGSINYGPSPYYWNGYISNLRVVKSAVYTAAFTPPTTPLTAITNTSLLTCQSNRFVDNSTNAFAITRNGDVRVTPFSPFAPSAAYSASTNGGSGYFDGGGNYLSIADAAGLRFGTGNFTIQAWIYRNASGVVHTIAAKGGASTGWVFQVHSDNKLRFTQTTTNIDSTGTIPARAWTHVAVVREGTGTNQTKLYINGVNDGQATVTTDFNQTEQLNVGADRSNTNTMNGYISGFKYVVGTAETITVPTAPPTGGTALLNFTNAGIFDNTSKNVLYTVGNAQIDTTTKKYGTGSIEFDGNGDYLTIPAGEQFAFGTGDFTIEFWYYTGTSATQIIYDQRPASNGLYPTIYTASGTILYYTNTGNRITGTTAVNTSTWYHIAVSRSGTSTKLFVNGTQDGSTYTDSNNYLAGAITIGMDGAFPGNNYVNGFIDDLRVTKGVARYTANFTVPGKAFPDL